MIDNPDYSSSSIKLLVFQALKAYPTDAVLPLLQDEDVTVRSAAAREIQVRGEKLALDYVLPLCNDGREFVREIAAFTLGQLGTPTYPFRSESIPKLMELAVDSSAEVRGAAVAALGHLHAVASKDVLLNAAEDVNPDVRAMAAVALGRLGSDSSSPDILQALHALSNDPSSEVREWAELGIELAQSET